MVEGNDIFEQVPGAQGKTVEQKYGSCIPNPECDLAAAAAAAATAIHENVARYYCVQREAS